MSNIDFVNMHRYQAIEQIVYQKVRDFYNNELGYNNTSDHLYRIKVDDNKNFI